MAGKRGKFAQVMREFKHGTLRSGGSGKKVTKPAQARAIARSVSQPKLAKPKRKR